MKIATTVFGVLGALGAAGVLATTELAASALGDQDDETARSIRTSGYVGAAATVVSSLVGGLVIDLIIEAVTD
jgi:Na+-driven multidrug efflux pump